MGFLVQVFKWVPIIITAVNAVEAMSSGKGKQKQDQAVALVKDLIPLVEASISKDIVDDDKVQDAVRKVIDAVVALQNVVRDTLARRKV